MKPTDIGFEKFEEDFVADLKTIWIVPVLEKPIKVAFNDGWKCKEIDQYNIEVTRPLTEQDIKALFDSIRAGDIVLEPVEN